MTTALRTVTTDTQAAAMESVLIDGDLSKLNAEQRVIYYKQTCDSLGLNYLTKPFDYIRLNGKLTLYARKEATEQLRALHKVSIYKLEKEKFDEVFVVTAYARTADGKEDVATGAVTVAGLKGEALSNAVMKAETKAKRRVTLSVCGLGFASDETEVDSIPSKQAVKVNLETGELEETVVAPLKEIAPPRSELVEAVKTALTMDDLKNAYARAYTVHAGNLYAMQDITELKDKRKAELEIGIADFVAEMEAAEGVQS